MKTGEYQPDAARQAARDRAAESLIQEGGDLLKGLSENDRCIIFALIQTDGNRAQAAKRAGFSRRWVTQRCGDPKFWAAYIYYRDREDLADLAAYGDDLIAVRELARDVALKFDPGDMFDQDGNFRTMRYWSRATRRAVRGFSIQNEERTDKGGLTVKSQKISAQFVAREQFADRLLAVNQKIAAEKAMRKEKEVKEITSPKTKDDLEDGQELL